MTKPENTPPKGLLSWLELPPEQRDAKIAAACDEARRQVVIDEMLQNAMAPRGLV
jgi:hypothetical protein